MMRVHKLLATGLGIGYIGKGSGTIASLATSIVWHFVMERTSGFWGAIVLLLVVTAYGIWASSELEQCWGKDSNKIVIDEVAGTGVALLFVPVQLKYIAAGFVLFRFFDIAKPLLIRKMEKLPKGWGVMADDLLAGLYANIVLQLIVHFQLW